MWSSELQVVTVNDYLARRDSEWVGQVHRFLGLKVGLVQQGLNEEEHKAAYRADVTYVTNSELGFDYLRDNLAQVWPFHLILPERAFTPEFHPIGPLRDSTAPRRKHAYFSRRMYGSCMFSGACSTRHERCIGAACLTESGRGGCMAGGPDAWLAGGQSAEDLVLRDFNFCIIDEVDSILIDEARTPLIISGPAEKSSYKYQQAAQLAEAMERNLHYTVDEKQKSILITEEGYEAAEDVLQVRHPLYCLF